MAGIYDRIGGNDNVSVHLLYALLVAYAEGDVTRAQALGVINGQLTTALDSAAQADLEAMADDIDAASNVSAALRVLNNIHAYNILVEQGVPELTEAKYRTKLNLPTE